MSKLGISGYLTKATISSPLTPLFLVAAFILGLIATITIPREEEPQIKVSMVDIQLSVEGLIAADAAELVTKPLEEIIKSIDGVEHVYSQTADDQVLVSARFEVGISADNAILRVHEKVRANYDRMPLGIPEPLISGRGINDVAIVVLTLSAKEEAKGRWKEGELYRLVDELQSEIVKIDNIGLTYVAGGSPDLIRVEPDPEKLALYGITLQQLTRKIQGANRSFEAGLLRQQGQSHRVVAGGTLAGIPDIGLLLLTSRDGRPVYVSDVANVVLGPKTTDHNVMVIRKENGSWNKYPAINLAIAKRAGSNAVLVAEDILQKVKTLKGSLIPDSVNIEITRNYGETADEKANELLFHLFLATVSIVILIGFAIGWREASVTLVIIPMTILLTMFAANMMGYTINRVSLFALIFSIGILVDDAIVIIENIARHWAMDDDRPRITATIEAVSEVGNPTVVATLAVIAALLPMLFISGLMGPYMAPIPVNASAAMLFSFFVAVVIAPWLMIKVSPKGAHSKNHDAGEGALGRFYRKVATPIIQTRKRALIFLLSVVGLTFLSFILFASRSVTVKLLPFDNKSELQIVLDLAEGASFEDTERLLFEVAEQIKDVPEITLMQSYAGTAAPFNFNGLVRHYYLRQLPELGELQINLSTKDERDRTSHDIALDIRARIAQMPLPLGASLKVVEVPPGPPVIATLVAEIYGKDQKTRQQTVDEMKAIFAKVPYVVDIDDSIGSPRPRLHIAIDQDKLEFFGVEQQDVYDTIEALISGVNVGYSYRGNGRDPIGISILLADNDRSWTEKLASTPIPANALPGNRSIVELGDVTRISYEQGSPVMFRHNGHFTDMIMAELSGDFEAPIYGMLDIEALMETHDWGALEKPVIKYNGQPDDPTITTLLWDGEWEITYVTFRDMGIAFSVALLGIYVLVVGQFGSFKLPLVILTPVPLTLIGIILGHWIFDAAFTATSMIGFIALAGIIVRNSILLVDFIRREQDGHQSLRDVLLEAGAVRFKPILLTALAAMIGAVTILSDPIFQGLAISLLFGLASSTILTLLVIPAIYVTLRDDVK